MTDPVPTVPAGEAAAAPRGVGARTFGVVALVLAGLGFAAWFDLSRDAERLKADAAQRLASSEAALAQMKLREDQLAGDLREAQAKVALLETRLGEYQSQQAALEALYRDLSPSRDDLALSEVEQILLIANQQLGLAGNVPATIAALQLADQKVMRVDRPALAPLRRALARDLDRLRSLPYLDVPAIVSRLDQALSQVDALPLARDERLFPQPAAADPGATPAWRRALADLWRELRSLVKIEVSERPPAELVTPEQTYFLRENLRLRLQSARIAILARQEAMFRGDLRGATAWLKRYFDTRAKPVMAMVDSLTQLASLPVRDALPDLSASLDAVAALKAAQDKRPMPPPVTPARPNR